VAVFIVYIAAETTVALWGASYLVIARGIAPELAAGWLSLFFLGITLGRFLSGFLAMMLGNKQIIWLGSAIFGVGIVSIQLPLGNAAYLAGFFLMGLGCAPIFPTLLHSTPLRFGPRNSQSAIGVQMAGGYVGATVVPPIFGLLTTGLGHGFFPIFLLLLLAAQVVMIAMLNRLKPY